MICNILPRSRPIPLVNFVSFVLKKIAHAYSNFTRSGAALVRASAAPVLVSSTTPTVVRPGASVTSPTPQSAEFQWQRVSAMVEQSVVRAHDIGEQHYAARQQLDAAEYTLHRLIEELNEVMTLPVIVPQRVVAAVAAPDQALVRALAA
jgi:hypothetical protein